MKNRKIVIAVVIVILALSFLFYQGFQNSTTYYYTVNEFLSLQTKNTVQLVRINGEIMPGSIQQDTGNLLTMFKLAEGDKTLPVVYKGVTPDTFKAGADVVVEGKYTDQGVFQASSIITKCPSKYSSKTELSSAR